MIDRIRLKEFVEQYSFGVCTKIAHRMGLQVSSVRKYFIYISCVTYGSPIVLYLILAFWVNVRDYLRKGKNFIFD